MTSPTEQFFEGVKTRGHEPLLKRANGTVRYDIHSGRKIDHWLVTIDHGDVAVSRRNSKADTVLHADAQLFDRIVTGRANAMASMLRGVLGFEGNPNLAVLVRRLIQAGQPA